MQKKYIAVILLLSLILSVFLTGCSLFNKEEVGSDENSQNEEEIKYFVWLEEDDGSGDREYEVLKENNPKVIEVKEIAEECVRLLNSYDYRTRTLEDIYPYLKTLAEKDKNAWENQYNNYSEWKLVLECSPVQVNEIVFHPEYRAVDVYVSFATEVVQATEEFLAKYGEPRERTKNAVYNFVNNDGEWGFRANRFID